MSYRRAVIDLGTNTFHLLTADIAPNGRLTEVYRERIFVKLAADGIERIGLAPFERGISALVHFRKKLDEYKVIDFRAIGTAALRTATNGEEFVDRAMAEAGIPILLISGDEEADFITHGVLLALPPLTERILIDHGYRLRFNGIYHCGGFWSVMAQVVPNWRIGVVQWFSPVRSDFPRKHQPTGRLSLRSTCAAKRGFTSLPDAAPGGGGGYFRCAR